MGSTVSNIQWKTWQKPRGKSMLTMLILGGGAGGGGGFAADAGAARGGGGSGGSSSTLRVTIPLIFLPDTLYIQVGAGGTGRRSGEGVAGSGILSYVCIAPSITTIDVVAASGQGLPVGGGTGTGAAAGALGNAGAVPVISVMPLVGLGIWQATAGQAGVAGGAHTGAVGGAIAFPTTGLVTMGGTGGAGTTSLDFAGGLITAVAGTLISDSRPINAEAGSFSGSGGYLNQRPFWSYSGMSGGSSNTLVGGNGGKGGPGSGGGGGGGGIEGAGVDGRGGDGGDGMIVLIAW